MKKSNLYWILFIVLLGGAVYLAYSEYDFVYKFSGLAVLSVAIFGVFLQTRTGGIAIDYFNGARSEMRKVVWPKQNEVMQTTLMVFVVVLLFALILWLMDTLFYFIMGLIIQ